MQKPSDGVMQSSNTEEAETSESHSTQPTHKEGPPSELADSAQVVTPCTPLLDLARPDPDRKIYLVRIELTDKSVKREEIKAKAVKVKYGSEIEHNGQLHFVPKLPFALHQSLTLPTGAHECGSARELFDSINVLLRKHAQLPQTECALLTYWSLATWFLDYLPFLPSLVITGPAFSADLLLRALGAVCRQPILLADVNPAILRALPLGQLRPTLLIREPQLSKRLTALCDASSQPGYLVCKGKEVQELYCAKCVYVGDHAEARWLSPYSIHIHVGGKARRVVPPLPDKDVIDAFQRHLLFYRFVYHDVVAGSKFRVPVQQFRPEVAAIAQVLAAPLSADPKLQQGIIELLRERDEQARVDHSSGKEGMVLKALLWHSHQTDAQQLFVRELTSTVNERYRLEGESLKLSNESVGHILKSLGLYTRRLGNAGRGLVLDKSTKARVHELAQANEVLSDGEEAPVCGYCHKLQVSETQEFV